MEAATQVFYSMSLAFGGIIAYSSYLPKKNDCTKDAILTSVINLVTSIFTVTVVFSILGFKATVIHEKCLVSYNETIGGKLPDLDILMNHMEMIPHGYDAADIEHAKGNCSLEKELDQAAEGTGLAFIVFTQAIVEFPGAPMWSVILFLMLLALGFGSQFGTMQGVVTNVFDVFHGRITDRKEVLMGVLCVICFFFDILFVTSAGEYWVFLFDVYAASGLILIGFVQVVALSYVYGWERFVNEIEKFTGRRPGLYWTICWRFVSPVIIAVIFLASIILKILKSADYTIWDKEKAESSKVPLPGWALAIGIFLMLLSFLPLPIVFCIEFLKKRRTRAANGLPIRSTAVHRNESSLPMMGIDEIEDEEMPNGEMVLDEFRNRDNSAQLIFKTSA
ncbi:unnamed protein product [Notodromas monacha]|uniref:Uncharacterized protein n=1 Tax=Notodromas monacha TaxID=399045 RepID=A0A7R9BUJ3_9CRUS|nr:unnamed protein product [Notodromas monacha]CAG0921004.1 unnamed protein product [Notodromas monacha]